MDCGQFLAVWSVKIKKNIFLRKNKLCCLLGFDFNRIWHLISIFYFRFLPNSQYLFLRHVTLLRTLTLHIISNISAAFYSCKNCTWKFSLFSYVSVLISGDRDKLRLGEGESLHPAGLARVLSSVLVHLHHMQARLIFMQWLQDHHLHEFMRKNESQTTLLHPQHALNASKRMFDIVRHSSN